MTPWYQAAIAYLAKQRPEIVLLFLLFAAVCFGLYHLPAAAERALLRVEERHTEQLDRSTRAYEADQQRDHEMRQLMIEHLRAGAPVAGEPVVIH